MDSYPPAAVMHTDIELPAIPRAGDFIYFHLDDSHKDVMRAPVAKLWFHAGRPRVDVTIRDQPLDAHHETMAAFRRYGFVDAPPPYPWEPQDWPQRPIGCSCGAVRDVNAAFAACEAIPASAGVEPPAIAPAAPSAASAFPSMRTRG